MFVFVFVSHASSHMPFLLRIASPSIPPSLLHTISAYSVGALLHSLPFFHCTFLCVLLCLSLFSLFSPSPRTLSVYKLGVPKSLSIIKEVPGYADKIKPIEQILADLKQFWHTMLKPTEPLTCLGHGDVWTNNLFWKDGAADAGAGAQQVRIIDLQTFRYGNPSIDLSNFLCICVHGDVLLAHFDELLAAYQRSFVGALQKLGVAVGAAESLEAFREDYARHGKWGLLCALQWLPVMMGLGTANRSDDLHADLKRSKRDPASEKLEVRLCRLIDFYEKHGWL